MSSRHRGTASTVNINVLLLGDLTLAPTKFETKGYSENVREEDTINAGIGRYLQAKGYNHTIVGYCNEMMMIDKDNQGVNSVDAQLDGLSDRWKKFYDIVVISAGMNHLRRSSRETVRQIAHAMQQAVEEAIEVADKQVILVGLPPSTIDRMNNFNRREFEGLNPTDIGTINQYYRNIAADHIGIVT